MGKQLIIIRHAKSDWGSPSLTDFNRPLNRRGNANAPEMANRMVNQNIVPQLIVSSPAIRALTTAKYFANAWQIDAGNIQLEPTIYEANVRSLLKVVNSLPNNVNKIALFGHNPGLTDFANYLCNANVYNMPTCSVVIIDFPFNNWDEISAETGKLALFDYPKNGED